MTTNHTTIKAIAVELATRQAEHIASRVGRGEVVFVDRGLGIVEVYAPTQEQAREAARKREGREDEEANTRRHQAGIDVSGARFTKRNEGGARP